MPAMIGFSRSDFAPDAGLKFVSCFWMYSGIWPASFGFAGVGLLPSGPWQAAHTRDTMVWPFDASAFSCASTASQAHSSIAVHKSMGRRLISLVLRRGVGSKKLIF